MSNARKSGSVSRKSNKNEGALRDMIAKKAYEIYVENGREDGKDFEHWLEAEMIIKMEKKKAK